MKKITIRFCDGDGNLLAKIKKDVNKPFIEDIPIAPIVEIDQTQRFTKWDKDIDSLTKDDIVTAVYETIPPFKFEEIDGKLYVSETDGRCMNTFYAIPNEYAGKKVFGILPGAFKPISANAASIFIPKTVKDIKPGAFDSCYNTTFLFENREDKAGMRQDCANFPAHCYYKVNEKNHFMDDEYEYLIVDNMCIVLRCLSGYVASIIEDHVQFHNKVYRITYIDDYAFYSPFCTDFMEIYIPGYIDTDNVMPDYIMNADIINY